jgi:hypothetical protein
MPKAAQVADVCPEEYAMRPMFIAIAATAFIAAPAAAQDHEADSVRGAAGAVEQMAPAMDRAANAMLDLDVGPLMDAARPYGPHVRHHHTLRQIARRDDPYFERHMRDSIYGATARTARTLNAIALAEPAMRQALFQMETSLRAAIAGVPPYAGQPDSEPSYRPGPDDAPAYRPQGDADVDGNRDAGPDGPDDEPYSE